MKKFCFLVFCAISLHAQDSLFLAEHLALGNPNDAITSVAHPENYLMAKKQYVLSYNRFLGIANWVAWHTDSLWLGALGRSNNFRADSSLPEKWYHVNEKSYRRSGYDRGHMCPSGDRTNTRDDNSMTFLMTNMVPQAPNNNQGAWAALEIYCRSLVAQGKELYIYAGGFGSRGFLDSGRVNIPEKTWKVILVLDAGENDIERVTDSTRVIAVEMPNDNSKIWKGDNWKKFRTSVDAIEKKTKLDFFKNVPKRIQQKIEARVDATK